MQRSKACVSLTPNEKLRLVALRVFVIEEAQGERQIARPILLREHVCVSRDHDARLVRYAMGDRGNESGERFAQAGWRFERAGRFTFDQIGDEEGKLDL